MVKAKVKMPDWVKVKDYLTLAFTQSGFLTPYITHISITNYLSLIAFSIPSS